MCDVVSPEAGSAARRLIGRLSSVPAGCCETPGSCEHQSCRLARADTYPTIVAAWPSRAWWLLPVALGVDVALGVVAGSVLVGVVGALVVLATAAGLVAGRRSARRRYVLPVAEFRQPDLILLADLGEALQRQVAASARCGDLIPPVRQDAARERLWVAADLLRSADRLRTSAPDAGSDAGRAALELIGRARDEVAATVAAARQDADRLESLALVVAAQSTAGDPGAVHVDARIAELAAARSPDAVTPGSLADDIRRALEDLNSGS